MLRKFIIALGAALCFSAPAHAQNLGDLFDTVVRASTSAQTVNKGSYCSYYQGLAAVACRVNGVREAGRQIDAYGHRAAEARRAEARRRYEQARLAEAARAYRSADRVVVTPDLLWECSWSSASYCPEIRMTPQQAARLLTRPRQQPPAQRPRTSSDERYYVSADEREGRISGM